MLEDIACLTGGTVVSVDKGMKLDQFDPEWFGSAKVVSMNNKQTTIVDGYGDSEVIKNRCEEIQKLIDESSSSYEKEGMQERLGKLIGGVAIMKVGANSELEMKEKKDRVEDAIWATKAALKEGIVSGGGIALLNASKKISAKVVGEKILLEAIQSPFYTILDNARIENERKMK